MGSGTTGVVCAANDRDFIGIEKDISYFRIAEDLIKSASAKYGTFSIALTAFNYESGQAGAGIEPAIAQPRQPLSGRLYGHDHFSG